jgi:hypothetical protein
MKFKNFERKYVTWLFAKFAGAATFSFGTAISDYSLYLNNTEII